MVEFVQGKKRGHHNRDDNIVIPSLEKIISLTDRASKFATEVRDSVATGSVIPVGDDFGQAMISMLKAAILETYDEFVEAEDEIIIGPVPKPSTQVSM